MTLWYADFKTLHSQCQSIIHTHVPRISLNSNIFLMSSTCFFHDPFTDSSLPLAMVLPGSALPPNNLLNASIFPALQETLTDKDANASIGLCDYLTDFNRCPHSVSCRPVPPQNEDWPTNPIARTHRGSRLTDSPRRGAEPTERVACPRKSVILYSWGVLQSMAVVTHRLTNDATVAR